METYSDRNFFFLIHAKCNSFTLFSAEFHHSKADETYTTKLNKRKNKNEGKQTKSIEVKWNSQNYKRSSWVIIIFHSEILHFHHNHKKLPTNEMKNKKEKNKQSSEQQRHDADTNEEL
ncbi:CLUMA_CG016662, isoform A [Clunio marinus]|uniref:CLUMA_CG016662, isoform A n=1 Tax=Clunio marinus TaxID=568069 RepID=A0A1J1IUH0_9DIPT|nr:CLUMA_CG016662, isoform A [Clunio marinus]